MQKNVFGLGLLRTLLALAVVIAHTSSIFGYKIVDAVIAVQGFYIISGFYMALILNEKYVNNAHLFYTNRFLRLYPIYFVILLSTLLLAIASYFHNGQWGGMHYIVQGYKYDNVSALTWIFTVVTNLTIVGQDWVPFLAFDSINGNIFLTSHYYKEAHAMYKFMLLPQTWTIGLEIMFYVLAPWLVKRNYKIIVGVIGLSFGVRVYLRSIGLAIDPWSYRFFPSELALFLMGVLAYKYYNKQKTSLLQSKISPMVTMVVIILTLVFNYIPLNYAWKQWGYYFLIMISLPFIFSYSQKSSIDRYIGDLSYPIYMAHSFVILAIIAIYPANWSQQTVFGFVTVIFSIILAAIIMRYVQAPIEHIREKRVKNSGGDIIAEMLPISRELQ
ncbi:MAG: hypothetical protein K0R31_873 [Clostridiales bacterium]|jgi:peptidoglycan/LPS O-acetylase OafA/YrhL|nr:hypothetical protein [Clostridiales bacterium]